MKRNIFFASIALFILLSGAVFAQSTNWADYGLDEDAVKYLTDEEKQEILNSKTPSQTIESAKKGLEDGSIKPEDVPPQILQSISSEKNNNVKNEEIVSCFDYYTFNSVTTNISSRTSSAVSGSNITFFGDIKNNNPYPIVEGTLYVKIFKNIGDEKNPNGPDVVDQFVVRDNISLSAQGSLPIEFSWKIPTHAVSGDYRIVTYFTSDKKFNLQGLSFTDDIVGNSFDFDVAGEQEGGIMFDKSSVQINGDPYYFAAYPPRISKELSANISLDILNNTDTNQKSVITWKLYKWDAMSPDNLIREFTTNALIEADSIEKISVMIEEDDDPVYLLVGEISYQDAKSIVNIRYVREGVDKVRLNYPGVTSYPIIKGQNTTVFTCLHNAGQSPKVDNNKVVLQIKDTKGRVIESYTYEGEVTGDMMAVKKDFKPKTTLDKFSVYAAIYTDGKLVDESSMEYNCADIDPSSCSQKQFGLLLEIVIGLGALLIVLIVSILIRRKILKQKTVEIVLIVLLIGSSIVFLDFKPKDSIAQTPLPAGLVNPEITSASRQVVWSTTVIKDFVYFFNWSGETGATTGWFSALSNPNISVKYNTKIVNTDTNQEISEGASVSEGDNLRLQFIPHHPYDIYWFGTGYSGDSPYGEWRNNADAPVNVNNKVTCEEKDLVLNDFDYYNYISNKTNLARQYYIYDIYIPLVISQPVKTISNISGLTCGQISGNETTGYYTDCTVNPLAEGVSQNQINFTFNFSNTFGKFYYRWWQNTALITKYIKTPVGCYGNNIPMQTTEGDLEDIINNEIFDANSGSTFNLQIPAQTISYSLTAISSSATNTAPTISISGPTSGEINAAYSFNFTATDQESNNVKIEVDWNNDGVGDELLPSGAEQFVSSGVTQTGSKSWSSFGNKTIKARAIDQYNEMSSWASHSITISEQVGSSGGVSCSVSEPDLYISPTGTAVFNASVSGQNQSITYTWSGNGENYSGNSFTFNAAGRTLGTYVYTVTASSNGENSTATCAININETGDLPTNVLNPVDVEFQFYPSVINSANQCPLYLTIDNVAKCELRGRGGQNSGVITSVQNIINVTGDKKYNTGTYSLWCSADNQSDFELVPVGTRSCTSNSEIREN